MKTAMNVRGNGKSLGFFIDDASLETYLKEIWKIPLIGRAEEARLARRIRQGKEGAFEKLVKSNLRFTVSVARKYQHQGVKLADLINEGNLGLIEAAQRFDETRGFTFISHAVWWIRRSIQHALIENSRIVRQPFNRVQRLIKIRKASGQLAQTLGRAPSPRELAKKLRLPEAEVEDILTIPDFYVSLDAPLAPDTQDTLHDVVGDKATPSPLVGIAAAGTCQNIREALEELPERDAEILILLYGLNSGRTMELEEVGARYSLTRERVRQIKVKSIHRLRHSQRGRMLLAQYFQPDLI